MNLCKAINCPYFNSATNGYGCQRYMVAPHCHLINPTTHATLRLQYNVSEPIEATQYTLCLNTNNQKAITYLKQNNNSWLSQDKKYKDDLAFVESHQDWFTKDMWKVTNLSTD